MNTLPTELLAGASPLVAVLGDAVPQRDALAAVIASINSQVAGGGSAASVPTYSSAPPLRLRVETFPLSHVHTLPRRSRSHAHEYESYGVTGILRSGWLHKHHNVLPCAAVVVLPLDARSSVSPADWAAVEAATLAAIADVRAVMKERETPVVWLLLQDGVQRAAEDGGVAVERISALRRRAGVDSSSLLYVPVSEATGQAPSTQGFTQGGAAQPSTVARSLEGMIRDRVVAYVRVCVRAWKDALRRATAPTQAPLRCRINFKIGQYQELRGKAFKALKYYSRAYVELRHISSSTIDVSEMKAVGEILNFKICHGYVQHGFSQITTPHGVTGITGAYAATMQFQAHLRFFEKQLGERVCLWQHFAWMSKQYLLFAELLQLNLPRPTTDTRAQFVPSHYYHTALLYAIKRRRAAEALGVCDSFGILREEPTASLIAGKRVSVLHRAAQLAAAYAASESAFVGGWPMLTSVTSSDAATTEQAHIAEAGHDGDAAAALADASSPLGANVADESLIAALHNSEPGIAALYAHAAIAESRVSHLDIVSNLLEKAQGMSITDGGSGMTRAAGAPLGGGINHDGVLTLDAYMAALHALGGPTTHSKGSNFSFVLAPTASHMRVWRQWLLSEELFAAGRVYESMRLLLPVACQYRSAGWFSLACRCIQRLRDCAMLLRDVRLFATASFELLLPSMHSNALPPTTVMDALLPVIATRRVPVVASRWPIHGGRARPSRAGSDDSQLTPLSLPTWPDAAPVAVPVPAPAPMTPTSLLQLGSLARDVADSPIAEPASPMHPLATSLRAPESQLFSVLVAFSLRSAPRGSVVGLRVILSSSLPRDTVLDRVDITFSHLTNATWVAVHQHGRARSTSAIEAWKRAAPAGASASPFALCLVHAERDAARSSADGFASPPNAVGVRSILFPSASAGAELSTPTSSTGPRTAFVDLSVAARGSIVFDYEMRIPAQGIPLPVSSTAALSSELTDAIAALCPRVPAHLGDVSDPLQHAMLAGELSDGTVPDATGSAGSSMRTSVERTCTDASGMMTVIQPLAADIDATVRPHGGILAPGSDGNDTSTEFVTCSHVVIHWQRSVVFQVTPRVLVRTEAESSAVTAVRRGKTGEPLSVQPCVDHMARIPTTRSSSQLPGGGSEYTTVLPRWAPGDSLLLAPTDPRTDTREWHTTLVITSPPAAATVSLQHMTLSDALRVAPSPEERAVRPSGGSSAGTTGVVPQGRLDAGAFAAFRILVQNGATSTCGGLLCVSVISEDVDLAAEQSAFADAAAAASMEQGAGMLTDIDVAQSDVIQPEGVVSGAPAASVEAAAQAAAAAASAKLAALERRRIRPAPVFVLPGAPVVLRDGTVRNSEEMPLARMHDHAVGRRGSKDASDSDGGGSQSASRFVGVAVPALRPGEEFSVQVVVKVTSQHGRKAGASRLVFSVHHHTALGDADAATSWVRRALLQPHAYRSSLKHSLFHVMSPWDALTAIRSDRERPLLNVVAIQRAERSLMDAQPEAPLPDALSGALGLVVPGQAGGASSVPDASAAPGNTLSTVYSNCPIASEVCGHVALGTVFDVVLSLALATVRPVRILSVSVSAQPTSDILELLTRPEDLEACIPTSAAPGVMPASLPRSVTPLLEAANGARGVVMLPSTVFSVTLRLRARSAGCGGLGEITVTWCPVAGVPADTSALYDVVCAPVTTVVPLPRVAVHDPPILAHLLAPCIAERLEGDAPASSMRLTLTNSSPSVYVLEVQADHPSMTGAQGRTQTAGPLRPGAAAVPSAVASHPLLAGSLQASSAALAAAAALRPVSMAAGDVPAAQKAQTAAQPAIVVTGPVREAVLLLPGEQRSLTWSFTLSAAARGQLPLPSLTVRAVDPTTTLSKARVMGMQPAMVASIPGVPEGSSSSRHAAFPAVLDTRAAAATSNTFARVLTSPAVADDEREALLRDPPLLQLSGLQVSVR